MLSATGYALHDSESTWYELCIGLYSSDF